MSNSSNEEETQELGQHTCSADQTFEAMDEAASMLQNDSSHESDMDNNYTLSTKANDIILALPSPAIHLLLAPKNRRLCSTPAV